MISFITLQKNERLVLNTFGLGVRRNDYGFCWIGFLLNWLQPDQSSFFFTVNWALYDFAWTLDIELENKIFCFLLYYTLFGNPETNKLSV